jgi:hypothetical protein
MMDSEKVIKGLECIVSSGNAGMRDDCANCVYPGGGDCLAPALQDALALLKAQEPRVMAYEELSTIDGAFIIESPAVHPLEWVFFFDTDAKSDAVWVQGFDGERSIVYREDYGIYVRCWTSRPDEKRRAETPWN